MNGVISRDKVSILRGPNSCASIFGDGQKLFKVGIRDLERWDSSFQMSGRKHPPNFKSPESKRKDQFAAAKWALEKPLITVHEKEAPSDPKSVEIPHMDFRPLVFVDFVGGTDSNSGRKKGVLPHES